jgi:hypothetical protein
MAALPAPSPGLPSVICVRSRHNRTRRQDLCLLSRDGQHHWDAGAAGEVSVGFCNAAL